MPPKKRDDSEQPTAAKPAAKKRARKQVAKKTARKSSHSSEEVGQSTVSFSPEVRADLAVKLVQLKYDATDAYQSNAKLSSRALDATFADALKRADMLLLAASGKSNENIHAYQLFAEEDGLMSYQEIADRFSEFEWDGLKSRNTVELIVEELVTLADLEIRKERDRHERLVAVRSGYPGGVYHLVDRVRAHIRIMINHTRLNDLLDDPKQVADVMGQFFFRLMEKKIPEDWERLMDEENLAIAGFESFIKYVCGGLTYEKFIGESPHAWMSLERLGCMVFFLETLGKEYPVRLQTAEPNLSSLMRLVNRRDGVPSEAISDLESCLEELKKREPNAARVMELASSAGLSLLEMGERWYLTQLASAQGFSKLIDELGNQRGEFNRDARLPAAKVEQIMELLRRADYAGKAGAESMDVSQLRQLLNEVRQVLEDSDLNTASKVAASYHNGQISDKLKKVVNGLKKGLQSKLPVKPPAKRHAQKALDSLLDELKPYRGERRCRPYELLLFAAQKRLLVDKLVRSRSSLTVDFNPNPPSPSSLSILETHKGANLAIGIEDPR